MFLSLILFLCLSFAQDLPKCYYHDGSEALGHTPCTANATSLCCPEAYDCHTSGLCAFSEFIGIYGESDKLIPLYNHDFIDVFIASSCTDKKYSCPQRISCPKPGNDTECDLSSLGYLPLKGCTPELQSLVDPSAWHHCDCSDRSCAGAQKIYEAIGPIGDVICPAWRTGQPFGTYCGGTGVRLPSSPLTSVVQTVFRSTHTIDVTMYRTSSPTGSGNSTNERNEGFPRRLTPIPVFCSVAAIVVLLAVWMRRRQRKTAAINIEALPPPYFEATEGAMGTGPSSSKDVQEPNVKKDLGKDMRIGAEKDDTLNVSGDGDEKIERHARI